MKTAIKYQLIALSKPTALFYCTLTVIYLGFALIFSPNLFYRVDVSGLGGAWIASMIFVFVMGIALFKENFKMFIQNRQSRRTVLFSYVCALMILCALMALAGHLFTALIQAAAGRIPNELSLYRSSESFSGFAFWFEAYLWRFSLFTLSGMLGYMTALAYYRMSKSHKIIVSVGVPTLLVALFPILDHFCFNYAIGNVLFLLSQFLLFSPYIAAAVSLSAAAAAGAFSLLLIRKAAVKE